MTLRPNTPRSSTGHRPLSRKEAKAVTRARLLEVALHILDTAGEAAVTTTEVTRLAGIAQPSFYAHFADIDDLLHCVIDGFQADLSRLTREARREARRTDADIDSLRETFWVPLGVLVAHPTLTRLLIRSRLDPVSPLGEWSRKVWADFRQQLIDDLVAAGLQTKTDEEQRRLALIAEGLINLTEGYALMHLEGRCSDLGEAIDALVLFSQGYLRTLRHPAGKPVTTGHTQGGAPSPGRRRTAGGAKTAN